MNFFTIAIIIIFCYVPGQSVTVKTYFYIQALLIHSSTLLLPIIMIIYHFLHKSLTLEKTYFSKYSRNVQTVTISVHTVTSCPYRNSDKIQK